MRYRVRERLPASEARANLAHARSVAVQTAASAAAHWRQHVPEMVAEQTAVEAVYERKLAIHVPREGRTKRQKVQAQLEMEPDEQPLIRRWGQVQPMAREQAQRGPQ